MGDGPLLVQGAVIRNYIGADGIITLVNVAVSATGVNDAAVTINGTTIDHNIIDPNGTYALVGVLSISAGDDVTLVVSRGTHSVSATIKLPEKPVFTQPSSVGPYTAANPINTQWNAFSTAPDSLRAVIDKSLRPTGQQGSDFTAFITPTTTTTYDVPGGTFDTGLSDAQVQLEARNVTTSLGADAEPGSAFNTGYEGYTILFETQ